ncbi:MAG TPA: outer membrane beta-barrel protein [Terriglobales bacterium]|nr:outer membrane beta-barrel protein [Terriglobales bacterium]
MQVQNTIKRLFPGAWMQLLASAFIVLTLASYSQAQDEHRLTASFGAGFTPLVGDLSNRLNNGWHITFGGGVNVTQHFATTLDYSYHGFGVNRSVLAEAGVPGANSHLWSLTVNPKIRLSTSSRFQPFIAGGVGYYRRVVEFTTPTVVPVFLFDPFFGVFFNTLVPANQVIGSVRRGGVGGSLGGGFEFKVHSSGVKLFTEARYHYADTGRIITRMVPVTFGIRW